MPKYASEVVKQIAAWVGLNESAGTHKQIIDIYNSHKPHPRGYKMTYKAPWCATTVSAVAITLGYTDIIPVECSCTKMIELFKKLGAWVEDENRTPNPGDILFYDWDDNGVGDNKGGPEHVGIVEKVANGKITIIEGNYSNSVKRRTLSVNGRYIRGYGVPKYDTEDVANTTTTSKGATTVNVELKVLKKGSKNNQVKTLQRILYAMGYALGSNPVDGVFGSKTDAAVRAYQKKHKLEVDGIVGEKTWVKLLKG